MKNRIPVEYYEELAKTVNYNPETGEFTWKDNSRKNKPTSKIKDYLYIRQSIKGVRKNILSHRLAWFICYNKIPSELDHINRIPTDNSIVNLREVSRSENCFNKGLYKNNKSGYKGVYKKGNKWYSQLRFKGTLYSLGYYSCPKEAHQAYVSKKNELSSNFNFSLENRRFEK